MLSTKSAGGITQTTKQSGDRGTVKILRKTFVASLERDAEVDETVKVSDADARYLIATKRAKAAAQNTKK